MTRSPSPPEPPDARDLEQDDGGRSDAAAGREVSSGFLHAFRTRVYYADTDFSGIVYHGRYLEFLERGRSDLLHMAGIRHRDLAEGRIDPASATTGEPLAWVVRRITIEYRAPARIEDEITVETGIDEARGARLLMPQRVACGPVLILEARVEAALVTQKGRPQRIPPGWIDRLLTPGTPGAGR